MLEPEMNSSVCHCVNMRRASHALTEYYDDALRPYDLSLNQYSLLKHLQWIEPCSVSDLAKVIRLDRTTLVRNLQHLIAAGLVCDEKEEGKRARKLSCTPKGNQLLAEAIAGWMASQHDLEECIGKEEMKQLTETLLKIEKMNAKRRER